MEVKCKHGISSNADFVCPSCLEIGDRAIANMSVPRHFMEAAKSFFYFRFLHCLVDIIWAIQKLTNTGEFGPDGYFVQKGYYNAKRKTESTKGNE